MRAPLAVCLSFLLAGNSLRAVELPRPSYDNSVVVYVDAPNLLSDSGFAASADYVLQRLNTVGYGRVGLSTGFSIDMPWNVDFQNPYLSNPAQVTLFALLARAQARGLSMHLDFLGGVSRAPVLYDAAKQEDRRSCQWFMDGSIMKSGQSFSQNVWVSLSRYARKVHRHISTKAQLLSKLLVSARQAYPENMTSASGDAEAELNDAERNDAAPYNSQIIADYSPFAIMEFRDWIRHTGLYDIGQPYANDGYFQGGSIYQGSSGLSTFNSTYGTAFTSWSLKYWDWSLSDPIDGDPKAIPYATYNAGGWNPLPSSGANYIAGGFDPPRAYNTPTSKYWDLWQEFRTAMVNHYVRDFAGWMTGTPGPGGATLETNRWYSHQIPSEYIRGGCPGCPNPDYRLMTSASTMLSATVGALASPGWTVFDTLEGDGYHRTTKYLYDDVVALHLPNWGMLEYSPSWPLGVPDSDVVSIAAQIKRAYDAGAHVLVYTPWQHFIATPNPTAFNMFLTQIKDQPRDSASVVYTPPQVLGVKATISGGKHSVKWSKRIFIDLPDPQWANWAAFNHFEVWRGATSGFTTANGQLVTTAATTTAANITPDGTRPYYKVLAVDDLGNPGPLSPAAIPAAARFYTLSPCRVIDTRSSAPSLAAGAQRVIPVAGVCGLPSDPTKITAIAGNVSVVAPAAAGYLTLFPSDGAVPTTSVINFAAGQIRTNNVILPTSADGELTAKSGSGGALNFILDVIGYFD